MKVGKIKSWLSDEYTPFTWQRVCMRLLPQFRAEGLFFHQIKDDVELSDQLVEQINQVLMELYQANLPSESN